MTMSFDPSPPKQGNETISISVKDASGNAVKGAIVKAMTTMPAMSMSGPALTFQDNGDGTYSAVTNMNYQTKWVLDVKATAPGKSGAAEFDQDVT
jgi:nitrogen fixation protein FixH